MTTIEDAIATFAQGFAFTRSFTHPYHAERVGPLWLMRDAERKNPRDYRNEEWLAYHAEPAEVDRIARQHTRGKFAVCAFHSIDDSDEPLRGGFKKLGYRLNTTESLMVHDLKRLPRFTSPAKIERVLSEAVAKQLAIDARSSQIPKKFLKKDAPLRMYVAKIDGQIVGWARSNDVSTGATWCSSMYVNRNFRRRGIAKAMLCKLLRDDRAAGADASVLLASHAGAMLYPVVGYKQIATLLLFTPRRK